MRFLSSKAIPFLRAWLTGQTESSRNSPFSGKSPLRRAAFIVFLAISIIATLHVCFHIALDRVRISERHMDMATASMMSGQYSDALDHYDEVLQGNRRNRQAWSGRALTLLYLKRYDEALRSYERVIRLSPGDAPAWQGKGISLEFMGRYEEAIESYNHAIEIDPTFGQAIQLRDRLGSRIHPFQ
jgi:tetratricopeptide (TPR) repeat protein